MVFRAITRQIWDFLPTLQGEWFVEQAGHEDDAAFWQIRRLERRDAPSFRINFVTDVFTVYCTKGHGNVYCSTCSTIAAIEAVLRNLLSDEERGLETGVPATCLDCAARKTPLTWCPILRRQHTMLG